MLTKRIISFIIFLFSFQIHFSQTAFLEGLHGNFQLDMQSYTEDTLIGAPDVAEDILINSYANFNYIKNNFSAGLRYEAYLNPLQGYDKRYEGMGIPYRFVSYKIDELEITAGNYYEQFGNGLIFRTYEDKQLGYDNAMDGVSVKCNPFKGIYLKGVFGKQRYFWDKGNGIVRGADAEFFVNDIFQKLADKKTQIIFGSSFVSKFQKDLDPIYKLPENVGAVAGRVNILYRKFNLSSEYAYKINDPSADNGFIYKPGNALMINTSYSTKGLGLLLSTKRLDNMSFRSDRNANLMNLNINYLPTIAKPHTYTLSAMYPYATQPNGEIGFSGEINYKIKKDTKLGGKYGTAISLNFSQINSIQKSPVNNTTPIGESGTLGYKSDFFAIGDEIYFQDFNIEINKRLSKDFALILTYQNLIYNYDVIRGVVGRGIVYAQAGIADITYKVNDKKALRLELQGLFTEQDYGDWAMALLEYSIAPHWFFTASDQYNYGNDDPDLRTHYYTFSITYVKSANRFQIGYGRQRAGVMCVGGVCRQVPASNGFILSVTSSF